MVRGVTVVDAPLSIVRTDPQYPDADSTYRLEHLVALHRLAPGMPPVLAVADLGGLVVTGGHANYHVAKQLGLPTIHCIVRTDDVSETLLGDMVARGQIRVVDFEARLASERANPYFAQWHLLYFDWPLSDDQKRSLEAKINDFFEDVRRERGLGIDADLYLVRDLQYADQNRSVHYRLVVVDGDEAWAREYLAALREIDETIASIDTFLGHRLPWKGDVAG
jgi:hypothetical protein